MTSCRMLQPNTSVLFIFTDREIILELPTQDPQWERQLLEKIALEALKEQKAKRRWGIFFKLAFLAYLVAVLVLVVDWGGSEKLVDGKHTALINLRGTIEAGGETSAERSTAPFNPRLRTRERQA